MVRESTKKEYFDYKQRQWPDTWHPAINMLQKSATLTNPPTKEAIYQLYS